MKKLNDFLNNPKKLNNNKKIAIQTLTGFGIGMFIFFLLLTIITYINIPQLYSSVLTTILGVLLALISLLLIFNKKYTAAKYLLALSTPYVLIASSIIVKSNGYFINIYTFLTPKFLTILFLMAPVIFFGIRQKKHLIISLLILSPIIVFFDSIHEYFGIDIQHLQVDNSFYPLFLVVISLFYAFVLLSMLFVEKSNLLYKQQIDIQKEIIEKDKEELKILVEQNNLIASNINDFVWMFDLNLKPIYVNPTCFKFTGYTEQELMNIDFKVLHTEKSYQKIIKLISQAEKQTKDESRQVITEVEYIKKDGTLITVEVIGKSVYDKNGKKTAIVGVSRDITLRKQHERELLFQSNLYKILNITSKNKPLLFILQEVLDQLLTIEGLDIKHKGLIFLTNKKGVLEIAAHTDVDALLSLCSSVKKGQCLCGKVLESKQKMFCSHVDHKHDIIPPNMKPHGHYVVPIMHNDNVLGVINIYIDVNQKKESKVETFLEAVANVLARKIISEKNKEQLKKHQIEIAQKNKFIESTLHELNQSISYAQFLQKSLMPNQETINHFFKESSVLFLPKDKVSGDFYFAHEVDNKLIFGIGDCTGHGIPGSMLASMSVEAVKYLVETSHNKHPDEILTELREVAKKRFSINLHDKRSDSMDAIMCMYDREKDKLYFSGGFLDLIIVRNNKELIEYKGTKCPVGTYPVEYSFELHEIDLQKEDVLYLSSDGYIDQFGYPEAKDKPTKFKRKRFRELLINISNLPCNEQVKILKETLNDWRKDIDQIDDVTVFIAKH